MPLKAIIEFSFSSNSFFSTIYSIKLISFHPNRAITLFAKSKECVFKEKKKKEKKIRDRGTVRTNSVPELKNRAHNIPKEYPWPSYSSWRWKVPASELKLIHGPIRGEWGLNNDSEQNK